MKRTITRSFAAAIVCLPAASVSAQEFFGFDHTAVGQATLSEDASGRLMISNLGSSGKDGVSISLGETGGFLVAIDSGRSGQWATDGMTCATIGCPDIDDYVHLGLDATASGDAEVTLDFFGVEATCVTVELYSGSTLLDVRSFSTPLTGPILTGAFGTTGADPMMIGALADAFDLSAIICQATPVAATITGSSVGQVMADGCVISLDGLPPGMPLGDVRLDLVNPPTGVATIHAEGIVHRDIATRNSGPRFGSSVAMSGLGSSLLVGLSGTNICAGCPECCDPMPADPMVPPLGLHVSNIGSSGQDGVRIAVPPDSFFDVWPCLRIATSPIDLPDPQDALLLEARGVFSGTSDSDLGNVRLIRDVDVVQVQADYSPVGAQLAVVEVYDDGAFVGTYKTQHGPGVTIGTIQPGAAGLNINKCGKFGDDLGPPCFFACTEDDFTLFGGGQVLVGDDLRILAAGVQGSYEGIEQFDIYGRDIDDFSARVMETNADAPQMLVMQGLILQSEGEADLTANGNGTLTVSNIGSSGCDGVRIDLGDAQGGALRMSRGDAFFDIFVDSGECRWRALEEHLVQGGPMYTIDARHGSGPVQAIMTLRDSDGDIITSFPYNNDEPLSVSVPPGRVLTVKEVDAATPKLYMGLTDNAGGAVTVSHAVGGTHNGVTSLTLIRPDGNQAAVHSNMTLRLTNNTGLPGAVTLERAGVYQQGAAYGGLGGTRIIGIDCDDDNSDDGDDLYMCNIGSSGCDGVCIDIGDFLDVDSDDDGVPDNQTPGGVQMTLQQSCLDSCEPVGLCWSLQYRDTVGDLQSSDVCMNPLATGDLSVDVGAVAWMTDQQVRVRAIDENGQVLAESSGLMPGPVATIRSTNLRQLLSPRGAYQSDYGRIRRVSGAAPPPGTSEVEAVRFELTSGAPMLVEVSGAKGAVSVTTLEIGMRNASGQSAFVPDLIGAEVRRAADASSTTNVAFFLEESRTQALLPTCHADCAPINPDGSVGNSVINIDDLFGVINAISTQDHRCDVAPDNGDGTAGNLQVNFDDVIAVINDFGEVCGETDHF